MKYFIRVGLFVTTMPMMLLSICQAKSICKCPVLAKEHLLELYGTGKIYDAYRGYISHTKRKVTKEDQQRIKDARLTQAFRSRNGACTCWYSVRDNNHREIDQLGLEELEPKRPSQAIG